MAPLAHPSSVKEVATRRDGQEVNGGAAADLDCSKNICELQALYHRNKLLHEELRSMPWPLLTSFDAYGHTYVLPLQARSFSVAGAEVPQTSLVRYLAGFFDGDGCCHPSNTLLLYVSQSFDRAEILVLFRSVFGGGISRQSRGQGLKKPVLQWQLCGARASSAARLLAPHSIVKRRQLELAEDWLRVPSCREGLIPKMKALKLHDSCVESPCTWEYLAGFFDAEGNISVTAGRVRLVICQKFATVLQCVCRFLASELGCNLHVMPAKGHWRIAIASTPTSKRILQSMLQAGMVQKAQQARLALALTKENSPQIRELLFQLVGNQSFRRRLDQHGAERARKIVNAYQRTKRALNNGKHHEASAALHELESLKSDHKLKSTIFENEQLQAYILKLRKLQQEHIDPDRCENA